MKDRIDHKRRRFLGQLGLTIGGVATLGLHSKLTIINSALAAPFNDHKTLVCVFQLGGNDVWNMRVPTATAAYQRYANIRKNLAIDRNELLPIAGSNQGWHPALPSVKQLYEQGKLAVVTNVGNLFSPVTRDQYFEHLEGGGSISDLPPELFSHSHQQETFQTTRPSLPGVTAPGWGGIIADVLANGNTNSALPPSFSINGNNFWQAGNTLQPYTINPMIDEETGKLIIGNFNAFAYEQWPPWAAARSSVWEQIVTASYANPLEEQTALSILAAKSRADEVRSILDSAPAIATAYDDQNDLAKQLRSAAQLISVREELGQQRQIIFVGLGGWDTHANHLMDHATKLTQLNDALNSFQLTLAELGVEESVTTFTASEFGRTFTSNGDGTDHAWASEYLVMGGAVDGGKVHGEPIVYSDIPEGEHWGEKLFGPNDVGSGRFIPKYATDQYGVTLARWMGVSEADLAAIFPHLSNFSSNDLSFMA